MNIKKLLLASLLTLIPLTCSYAETVQLFIIAGQSNATGKASRAGLPDELKVQPDVRYWYDTDHGLSTKSGTAERGFRTIQPLQGRIGPETGAADTLADAIDEEIAIIKVSQGGTTLTKRLGHTDWNVDSTGELYDKLIDNVTEAKSQLLAEGKQVHLAGFFWLQGSSDAISGAAALPDGSVAAYQNNLERLIQETRADLAVPELPFFIGEIKVGNGSNFNTSIFGTYDFTPEIQAAQAGAAADDPNTYFIDSSSFALQNDHLHFNQAGQLDLGRAFANSYLATIPEPSTAVLSCLALGTMLASKRRLPPR